MKTTILGTVTAFALAATSSAPAATGSGTTDHDAASNASALAVDTTPTDSSAVAASSGSTPATTSCDRTVSVTIADHPSFDVHVACFENEAAGPDGATLLLIHGFVHNSSVFKPGVDWVFTEHAGQVRRIYAIDLPGHGQSGLPSDLKLGQLSTEDYVDSISQVIRSFNGDIQVLGGHSMGAMLIQMLQQRFIDEGSNIAAPLENGGLGIRGVFLMASTIPEELSWDYAEGTYVDDGIFSPMLIALLPYVRFLPGTGLFVKAPTDDFLNTFFTVDGEDEPVDGAPTGEEANLLNDKEPYQAAAELGGLDLEQGEMFQRPSIDPGIFSSDLIPAFAVAAYAQDSFLQPDEEAELYRYLSDSDDGGSDSTCDTTAYFLAEAQSVHDCVYSSPRECMGPALEAVLDKLAAAEQQ